MLNISFKNLIKTLIGTKSRERPDILGAIEQILMAKISFALKT